MILWWTYQQLRASSPKTRLAVIAKLVESDDSDSIEPLLFALKDKEPEVRIAAVEALGKIPDKRVMQPLLMQLRDPVAEVRGTVAEILGRRGDFQAIGALTGLLRDTDAQVGGIVSRSLERLGWKPGDESERLQHILAQGNLRQLSAMGPKAIPSLVELMRNGTPEKQFAAVKALGEISDPRISQVMVEVL